MDHRITDIKSKFTPKKIEIIVNDERELSELIKALEYGMNNFPVAGVTLYNLIGDLQKLEKTFL